MNHIEFMQLALKQAENAWHKAEVPIGAVLTDAKGNLLAEDYNQTIGLSDPTAHAEILVLRRAARRCQNYRLPNTILYVTIEPCVMCMGAILHARVARVIFGAKDPRWGAAGSLYDFSSDPRFNHHPEIISGVCEERCRSMIQRFFQARRQSQSISYDVMNFNEGE